MTLARPYTLAAFLLAASAGTALAQNEYQFTLVDSLVPGYSLRETMMWDMSDTGIGCGNTDVSDIDAQGNTHITTGAYYWIDGVKTRINVSGPHGVNNNGFIVGYARTFDIETGIYTDITGVPGRGGLPVLLGVNDSRTAVGYQVTCNCSNSQGLQQIPVVWTAQSGSVAINVPQATGAARINADGLVVGWIGGRASPDSFVFNLSTNQYTRIGSLFSPPPDGYNRKTTADDVSDLGVVTGSRLGDDFSTTYGYTWSPAIGGAPTLLPLPPAPYRPIVRPASINRSGVVVGSIVASDDYERAFVYDPVHGLRDLNTLTTPTPGFVMRAAFRINDQGWIVGYGAGGGGLYKSFVLRPSSTTPPCSADFNHDGDVGTDADIEAFFACLAGNCCTTCGSADFDGDGDIGTDADIESFFRVLSGGAC